MAVAEDHCLESGGFGLEVELGQVVQHIDRDADDDEGFALRQFVRPHAFINVAAHGRDRRDRPQPVQDVGCAHVSGMNNVLHSTQNFKRLGPKQAVRVGNNADECGGFQFLDPKALSFRKGEEPAFPSTTAWRILIRFNLRLTHPPFIFSTNLPTLITARPTVPRPISCFSSRAVTRRV